MAKEPTKLEIINESPKEARNVNKIDNELLEMVFGTPNSQNNNSKVNNPLHHNKFQPISKATNDPEQPSQPLLEPNKERQKPPLTGPEIDDLGDDAEKPSDATPYQGIDDGLLEPTDPKPTVPGEDGVNGLSPRFGVDDRPGSPIPSVTPDVNTYQQKKNLAQGMMDLALLSANANQLRYVLESQTSHPYYYPSLAFIGLSIILQIAVGVGLILNSRYDVNDKKEICKADKINNMTVLGIFLITFVNVFIASFSVSSSVTSTGSAVTPQQLAPNA
uniref:Ninjurin-1 n=1 Tax=Bombyx mori TaxID=7091 RepID=A0A8R2M303_BOMMO|nr:ninjurin-1 isoform X3 [Bombyx mori]